LINQILEKEALEEVKETAISNYKYHNHNPSHKLNQPALVFKKRNGFDQKDKSNKSHNLNQQEFCQEDKTKRPLTMDWI
jgi:hypothetical protein